MGCGDNETIGEQDEPRKPRIPRSFDQIDQVGTRFATDSLPGQIPMSQIMNCSLRRVGR